MNNTEAAGLAEVLYIKDIEGQEQRKKLRQGLSQATWTGM